MSTIYGCKRRNLERPLLDSSVVFRILKRPNTPFQSLQHKQTNNGNYALNLQVIYGSDKIPRDTFQDLCYLTALGTKLIVKFLSESCVIKGDPCV